MNEPSLEHKPCGIRIGHVQLTHSFMGTAHAGAQDRSTAERGIHEHTAAAGMVKRTAILKFLVFAIIIKLLRVNI